MLKDETKKRIAELCRQHQVALCYLFGSQVIGATDKFSDVDIGVVFAPGIERAVFERRLSELRDALYELFAPLEVDLVHLPDVGCQLAYTVLTDGKLLYCADDIIRADFEEKVVGEWLDWEPFLEKFYADMLSKWLAR